MKQNMPRVLLAAPKSGSGKTLITCGIIAVLKRRQLSVASFKCGPDYIDPMFHREVLGIASGNLDTYFTKDSLTQYLLWEKAKDADITILEGVMGYYDGLGGISEKASTYEVAKVTKTPVVLIVDGKGASVSLAAVIQGILQYRSDSLICGIILNRVSGGYYERLKNLIEVECHVSVLGYLPEMKQMIMPSRHLGLLSPKEIDGFLDSILILADQMEQTIDFDALLDIAGKAEVVQGEKPDLPKLTRKIRLAVAKDEAFSFYYQENLDLLSKMGAELAFFSPLHDQKLPDQIDGILLGGGYPEAYAKELEATDCMRAAIKKAFLDKIPCLSECGGFLYLQKELEGMDGTRYKMVGALEGNGYRTDKLSRFGYLEAEILSAGVLGDSGQVIKGHEFHYWDCTQNGEMARVRKPLGTKSSSAMFHTASYAVGFPHFYYYSNPNMLYEFMLSCSSFQAGRKAKEHWDSIAKPIDSLGRLEDLVVKLAKIERNEQLSERKKRALLIFCADHGVVQEGVTQTGSEVTQIVSENFAKGCSTVNIMAEASQVDVFTIDIGMKTECYPTKDLNTGAVIDRKVAKGSGNIAKESAMTVKDCKKAIQVGMDAVKHLKEAGYHIIATGEMGIGNTTPTSVLAALFMNLTPEEVTGKGAGLSKDGLEKKQRIVAQAVLRVIESGINHTTQPLEVLAEAGGYEIAGMVGAFLGGAHYRIPIVIDGAISAVAALVAARIDGRVPEVLLPSHESGEITGKLALKNLGLEAILHANMCLGEGSGAISIFPLLDMAIQVYLKMGTFQDYEIKPYTRFAKETR